MFENQRGEGACQAVAVVCREAVLNVTVVDVLEEVAQDWPAERLLVVDRAPDEPCDEILGVEAKCDRRRGGAASQNGRQHAVLAFDELGGQTGQAEHARLRSTAPLHFQRLAEEVLEVIAQRRVREGFFVDGVHAGEACVPRRFE